MEAKKSQKAHIYNLIIVDESGSMSPLREATMSGVNETIGTIGQAQRDYADTQTHTLTLVTFDSGYKRPDVRVLIDCVPIDRVDKFADYNPCGGTPLYDAIGQSLTALHARIKDDDDATAVVTILSDGYENSSREWTVQKVRELIERLTAEGWTFSYMGSDHDVKSVSTLLAITNVVEFSHDQLGTGNTWMRERSSRMAHYGKFAQAYGDGAPKSKEELMEFKRQASREYYSPRTTPFHIKCLEPNEIFVFGSNPEGFHSGGAAAQALNLYGAVWGQGEGLQGRSYAIPSTAGLNPLAAAVRRFTEFAAQHPELRFLVTRVGCGIAGLAPSQVAPLFRECVGLENVTLPEEFWNLLGLKL